MSGWWAAAAAAGLAVVVAGRELARWRGRRWWGGLRSGSRPDED